MLNSLAGTVFQTAALLLSVVPRLRPGLLSLRSVLPSRQSLLIRSIRQIRVPLHIRIARKSAFRLYCHGISVKHLDNADGCQYINPNAHNGMTLAYPVSMSSFTTQPSLTSEICFCPFFRPPISNVMPSIMKSDTGEHVTSPTTRI